MLCFKMLRRLFTKSKPNKLGRWQIADAAVQHRKVDLANCDSCGTCGVTEQQQKVLDEELYMGIEMGFIPVGSFNLNSKRKSIK